MKQNLWNFLTILLEKALDAGVGQVSPEIIEAAGVVQGLIKGVLGPFFVDYNCSSALGSFGAPSSEASTNSTVSVRPREFSMMVNIHQGMPLMTRV